MNRRRQHIVIRPDGSQYDEAVMRDYLASLDAKAKRVTVERLSRKEQAA